MRVHSRNDGFTLMELLVVIAIISILAGISMPVFVSAAKRSRYSGSARRVQAILMRAKKLAIQERAMVSVEFYQDSSNQEYYMQLESKNAKEFGSATGGSNSSLVDATKSWAADVWENGRVSILHDIGGGNYEKYSAVILSSANNTLNFKSLPVSIGAGDQYWVEGGIQQFGKRENLEEGIMFAFSDALWAAKDGWVGSSDENDDFPDIAFRSDGLMADAAEEGSIVIKEIESTDPTEKIVISVNKLTGFIGTEE